MYGQYQPPTTNQPPTTDHRTGYRISTNRCELFCDMSNGIDVCDADLDDDDDTIGLQHPYPATKIMWIPDTTGAHEDLLATSGDYLRIWQVPSGPVPGGKSKPKCLLDNVCPAILCVMLLYCCIRL
jgi:hypothetical protein